MSKSKEIRLGIGLPSTQSHLPAEFVDSFFCISRPKNTTYVRPSGTGPLDTVRNQLVDIAISKGNTHLIMMDTDQVYPANTITALLEHDKPFVAAKVHRRCLPYDPILQRGKIGSFTQVPDSEWENGGLVEVDATGFGCVLMDLEAVKTLPRPYFKFDLNVKPYVGEDIYFWSQVKEAGFKIYVDCDIKIGHLQTLMLTEESYWALKNYGDMTKKPGGE